MNFPLSVEENMNFFLILLFPLSPHERSYNVSCVRIVESEDSEIIIILLLLLLMKSMEN